ncbi:MAG: carbohydrate ABC transporter permease [Candidatus Eisenbacteria bacterium]|nr:carbohydrate ABC transporter permease [Candidatus Eisenbacteria bacterium]
MDHRTQARIRKVVLYAALTAAAVVVLFPFFWMVVTAFKEPGKEFTPDVLPNPPTLENFRRVLTDYGFGGYFVNSVIVATVAATFATLFAALAGYVFAKKRFFMKEKLFAFLLGSLMIPGLMYVVPQFAVVHRLGWMNTYQAMIVPHLANVFGLFLMRQYMTTIPSELLEAARMDGAGEWQQFRKVMVPLSVPILATLFLLTFQFHWNNFLWQLIVVNVERLYTVPVGLALFKSAHEELYTLKMAGSCISVIPIAALFFFAQRYFIEGMTMGALKG